MRPVRPAIALAALATLSAGCGTPAAVETAVYRAGPHPVTDQPGGSALTAPARSVDVSTDARARVVGVAVRLGDRVRSMQPLLAVDPSPFQRRGAETGTAQLLSPIDGVIAGVAVATGQVVTAGQPLVTVEDDTHLHVAAAMPVADRPLVVPGAAATVSVPSLPGVVLQGRVIDVAPDANARDRRTFLATVEVANTPNGLVIPNLQAFVRLSVSRAAAVVVPRAAVIDLDTDPTVEVVEGQVARGVHVEIGAADTGYVEVLRGLAAGALCMLPGRRAVDDGTPVRITTTRG